ncbi:lysine-specific demethylase JMJ31-like [Phragmites australis]|uniref:lysine-specific demethylase JMJ31-like n=1 Tax=Phragmites australis TaxID=29695 RepID=UPI002D773948|nr:lysine-specific demethylase JMJ31-like [Phragmites australis]
MQAAEEGEFVGARLGAGLRAARFASQPSSEQFADDVEPKNVPAVFRGVAKGWDASCRWDPLHGGLDYLLGKVGPDVAVEAMMSNTAHVFYGDLRSHERVSVPFSTFIQSCKSYLRRVNAAGDSTKEQGILQEPACFWETCSSISENSEQIYLAQVSILNTENKDRCSLEVLKEDIQEPIILRGKSISSINFWMNRAHLRSSTHYDPRHNLLCVVAGCKKVTLWPPSASPFLYPMPVYGEASNHSSVSIEEPDYSSYTRARYMKEYSERVVLNSGDVLFIPEGWYHQVYSDDLTIAVNFWWKSRIMTQMLEHMDAYYLRRILSRLVDKEMNIMAQKNPFGHSKDSTSVQPMDKALTGFQLFNLQKDSLLQTLESSTLQALYELISLVHDSVEVVNQNDISEPTSQDTSSSQSNETKKTAAADDSSLLDKDPVTKIILPVEPLELRSMLLAMVHTFPRTLEALVLNMLGPVGAEILTRKFDEMDQQTTKEEQSEFYKIFYSVFEDQYAAMDALLNGKELFSFQVFQNVLEKYLRVHVDRPS